MSRIQCECQRSSSPILGTIASHFAKWLRLSLESRVDRRIRRGMTVTPPMTDLRQNTQYFRVGHYALFSHRNCEQAREHFGLSQREVELLMHIAGGLTKNGIAKQMGVSSATTDTFRRRAYAKLGVNTGTAAVAILTAFLAGTRVESRQLEDAV